jgi:hypothetical protein
MYGLENSVTKGKNGNAVLDDMFPEEKGTKKERFKKVFTEPLNTTRAGLARRKAVKAQEEERRISASSEATDDDKITAKNKA